MNKVMKYIIEIVILLLIALAAFYGITKINTSVTRNTKKEVLVTFEAQNATEDLLAKVAIGDKITDNAKTTYLGTVTKLSENRPHLRKVENYEKKAYVQAPVEGYFCKDITVSVMADITDSAIMVGETELKIGYTIPIISEKYLLNCIITDLEIKE